MAEVFFVAGEASGDLHASGVAVELGRIRPDLKLRGIGGPRLAAAGVELMESYDQLSVMGLTEVIRHIPRHYALLKRVRERLRSGEVRLLVLIDYPGFNMRLAESAKQAGVPVLYYVTPQVWAWGAKRLPKLARTVTRAAVILPFEEQLLRGYGIDAHFVGHPLLDGWDRLPTREAARAVLGIDAKAKVLALYPGSRVQEITRHIEPFVRTARALQKKHPDLQVIISAAPATEHGYANMPYPVVAAPALTMFSAADIALCKSGTTTLEAAIAGCPMVVAYRVGKLSYAIARRMVKISHIGLVNIVAGREVAREFVQDALDPEVVAAALDRLLTDEALRRRTVGDLAEVRSKLGTPGASARVARMASELIG
ncbi:MAG TPA: lipid-A-disaccharide synthase [Gemmatimonadaceae bacterium]|nr:lipid-A-disaccharide synthase [Gemmatimonadaceae bacterium]